MLAGVYSCKKDTKPTDTTPVVGNLRYEKMHGTDCDKPDTLRYNCLTINLIWPNVENGTEALKKSVATWANNYLIAILSAGSMDSAAAATTVEGAAMGFIEAHKTFSADAPDSPMGQWTAEANDSTLLNDGKYLTLEINGFTYAGGAHGSPTAAVATFDALSGKQLTWDDLVADKAAVQALAEQIFRTTRMDIFAPEDGSEPFEFDETFQFALPQNYGLVEGGIYCHYLAYEVGPYAIGNTQFVIPFESLGSNSKIEATPGSLGAASNLYKMEGTEVIIPTFEIEVSNSLKANQTLTGQKETIIVAAFFSGEPMNEKDRGEDGQMFIVNKEIELSGDNRIARFEGLKFPKATYAKLADKDISLLINVYSGRKSSENNLLDCGIMEDRASKFRNKRFMLGCKLIEEPAQNNLGTSGFPIACYALPAPGSDQKPALLVTCTKSGQIEWAGQPVKDYDALEAILRPLLTNMVKNGARELPDLKTEGCLMGNSGEIRDIYNDLKSEVLKNVQ